MPHSARMCLNNTLLPTVLLRVIDRLRFVESETLSLATSIRPSLDFGDLFQSIGITFDYVGTDLFADRAVKLSPAHIRQERLKSAKEQAPAGRTGSRGPGRL